MIHFIINLPVSVKRWITILYDALMAPLALWIAWSLRLGEFVNIGMYWHFAIGTSLITAVAFLNTGYYRIMVSHLGAEVIQHSFNSVAVSVTAFALFVFLYGDLSLPRSVILIYGLTLFLLCVGGRMFARRMLSHPDRNKTRVAIYGTEEAGVQMVGALKQSGDLLPYLWLDENEQKWGSDIADMRVYSPAQFGELVEKHDIKEVLIALPALSRKQRKELLSWFSQYPVRVRLLPLMSELVRGRVGVDDLHEIDVDDLLGREQSPRDEQLMRANIRDKVVMVTGAGGSIGSELCRQVMQQNPRRLIMVEQSEYALYRIDRSIRESGFNAVDSLLGSVCDQALMRHIMRRFQVDTIYHAAAYKHVHLVESNSVEGLRNNAFGTKALAAEAIAANVETFVLISTDKSVNPRGIMGASKRLAEMILQAHVADGSATRFSIVRFGNVLDSSGSIVPLFKEQIKNRQALTLTHVDMTRYFMTINEAVELVIQAGGMARGGEVFVLDMGKPIKIDALARKMIRLHGMQVRDENNPDGDIEIIYTGMRPGEKISEELSVNKDLEKTGHDKILCSRDGFMPRAELNRLLDALDACLQQHDDAQACKLLNTIEGVALEAK